MSGIGQASGRSLTVTVYWFWAFGSLSATREVMLSIIAGAGSRTHDLIPDFNDRRTLGLKFARGHDAALAFERAVVQARSIVAVGAAQGIDAALRHKIRRRHRFELPDCIGVHGDRRVFSGPGECPVLRQEFDVGNASRILLEIEFARPGARYLVAHAVAHVPHTRAQRSAPHVSRKHLEADRFA